MPLLAGADRSRGLSNTRHSFIHRPSICTAVAQHAKHPASLTSCISTPVCLARSVVYVPQLVVAVENRRQAVQRLILRGWAAAHGARQQRELATTLALQL